MEILENTSLLPFNTFGLDVKSRYLVKAQSVETIAEAYQSAKLQGSPILPLGGGSNVLFCKNYEGTILKIDLKGIKKVAEDEQHVYLKVNAGEVWHDLVMYTIDQGLAGIENMSLIPGNAGAAPMQNIGAYGVEIKDVFHELEAYLPEENKIETFSGPACEFGYRSSIFKTRLKGKAIILNITLRLNKQAQINTSYGAIEQELESMGISSPGIREVSEAVIRIRQSKLPDPSKIGNAGSFFKNPVIAKSLYEKLHEAHPDMPGYDQPGDQVKVPAGWLIQHSGWKGKTFDDRYGVHKKQALVLVNYGGGSGNEIYGLSERIIEDVNQKYGITLEREVNIIK
ncbi:UDP-N-acetylmuramate dehydrogenase [bacterium SCSIO 12741]|nr:UDP-N-acetylmuramate dehydrogenase [bacterium SCSIO 12741]